MSAEQWKECGVPIARALNKDGKSQTVIADLLGVARNTISDWLGNNVESDIVSHLDCRVTIPPKLKPEIATRVNTGESTASIASEFKTTQRRIQQIVKAQAKSQESGRRQKEASG